MHLTIIKTPRLLLEGNQTAVRALEQKGIPSLFVLFSSGARTQTEETSHTTYACSNLNCDRVKLIASRLADPDFRLDPLIDACYLFSDGITVRGG